MTTQHDFNMEGIRAEAARKISVALDAHLEATKDLRLGAPGGHLVAIAAEITEHLATALAVVSR